MVCVSATGERNTWILIRLLSDATSDPSQLLRAGVTSASPLAPLAYARARMAEGDLPFSHIKLLHQIVEESASVSKSGDPHHHHRHHHHAVLSSGAPNDLARQLAVVRWLEEVAARDTEEISMYPADDGDTYMRATMNEMMLRGLQESGGLLAQSHMASASSSSSSSSSSSQFVTEMDPDAATRQGRQVHPADDGEQNALLFDVWRLVRAGRIDQAVVLCCNYKQAWRAATLCGGEFWAPGRDVHLMQAAASRTHARNSLDAAARDAHMSCLALEGNRMRFLWKQTCRVRSQASPSAHERAIYSALGGNLEGLLPQCQSWEDVAWAVFNQASGDLMDKLLTDHLRSKLHSHPAFENSMLCSMATPSMPIVDVERLFEVSDQRYRDLPLERADKVLDDPFRRLQRLLVLGDLSAVLQELATTVQDLLQFGPETGAAGGTMEDDELHRDGGAAADDATDNDFGLREPFHSPFGRSFRSTEPKRTQASPAPVGSSMRRVHHVAATGRAIPRHMGSYLRFAVHVFLHVKTSLSHQLQALQAVHRQQQGQRIEDSGPFLCGYYVIEAYVDYLIAHRRPFMVAPYVRYLRRDDRIRVFSQFLAGVQDPKLRKECLHRARQFFPEDLAQITKRMVQTVIQDGGEQQSEREREAVAANLFGEFFGAAAGGVASVPPSPGPSRASASVPPPTHPAHPVHDEHVFESVVSALVTASSAKELAPWQQAKLDAIHCFEAIDEEALAQANQLYRLFAAKESTYAIIELSKHLASKHVRDANNRHRYDPATLHENTCWWLFSRAMEFFRSWHISHTTRPQAPPQPRGDPVRDHEYQRQLARFEANERAWKSEHKEKSDMASDAIRKALTVDGGFLLVGDALQHMRSLTIPRLVWMAFIVFSKTEQYEDCLRLADLVAGDMPGARLYSALSQQQMRFFMRRLRDAQLAVLANQQAY